MEIFFPKKGFSRKKSWEKNSRENFAEKSFGKIFLNKNIFLKKLSRKNI